MEGKAVLFEGIMLEINWGQKKAQYRVPNPAAYNPTDESIRTEDTINGHIARYLNWCGLMVQIDKTQNTAHFTSPACLTKRNKLILAFIERLTAEKPNHPALIVLGKDLHAATLRHQQQQNRNMYSNSDSQKYPVRLLKAETPIRSVQ